MAKLFHVPLLFISTIKIVSELEAFCYDESNEESSYYC